MRKAIVAGAFYEKNGRLLDKQVEDCFLSEFGPGEVPVEKRKGFVFGAIAPHAGYMFSGPCAAWTYKEIGEAEFADVYVIIGPNHTGAGKTGIILDNFETPMGNVRVDQEFANLFMQKSGIKVDEDAHQAEHSIEVQLPFLQFVNKQYLNELKILPIVVSHNANYKKIGLDLKEAIMDSGKKVCIIASSDFMHYGRSYGFIPFSIDVQKKIYEWDGKALEFIKKRDVDGFVRYVDDTQTTICGAIPIAIMLTAISAKNAKVLHYYTSGDVLKDYKNEVGYAAVVFQ